VQRVIVANSLHKEKQVCINLHSLDIVTTKKCIKKSKALSSKPSKVVKKRVHKEFKKVKRVKKKIDISKKRKHTRKKKRSAKPKVQKQKLSVQTKSLKKISKSLSRVAVSNVKSLKNMKRVKRVKQGVKVSIAQAYIKRNFTTIAQLLHDNLYYPRRARKRGIEGKVVVKFLLTKDAEVMKSTVLSSSNEILSRAALKTLKELSGKFPKPTEALTIRVPIEYSLKNY